MFLFQSICCNSREYYNVKPETGSSMFSETLIATFQPVRCCNPGNTIGLYTVPGRWATSQASTPLDLKRIEIEK